MVKRTQTFYTSLVETASDIQKDGSGFSPFSRRGALRPVSPQDFNSLALSTGLPPVAFRLT